MPEHDRDYPDRAYDPARQVGRNSLAEAVRAMREQTGTGGGKMYGDDVVKLITGRGPEDMDPPSNPISWNNLPKPGLFGK